MRPGGLTGVVDPAAPDDNVAVVEDDGLAGSDGGLRRVEDELGALAFERAHASRGGRMPVTDLGRNGQPCCRGASTEIQFTPDAVRVVWSSAARGPTVTVPESASIFRT